MTTNYKRIIKLMKQNPSCYWCHNEVIYYKLKDFEKIPKNFATIDHLYSRRQKELRKKAEEIGKKLNNGAGVYYVLACFECNNKRSKI